MTLFGQEGGTENLRTGGASNLFGRQFYSKWDHNLRNKHYAALKSFWKWRSRWQTHQETVSCGNKSSENYGHFFISLHTFGVVFETSGDAPLCSATVHHIHPLQVDMQTTMWWWLKKKLATLKSPQWHLVYICCFLCLNVPCLVSTVDDNCT